jgi:predicted nucleic acid-binding protein
VLLDTTVAVAHLRGVASVSERLAQAQTRYLPAVALEHGLPLATRDAHFQRVPGLTVLDWR